MRYFVAVALILAGSLLAQAQAVRAPGDLVITLTLGGTQQFASAYTYTIRMDGTVVVDDRSHNLPASPAYASLFPPSTEKERALRLTDEQLDSLVSDFEAAGFYEMEDHYYGEANENGEAVCVNHAEAKALSISANGRTKSVSFFLGCSYSEKSPLKAFLALYDKVSSMIRMVKATPVK